MKQIGLQSLVFSVDGGLAAQIADSPVNRSLHMDPRSIDAPGRKDLFFRRDLINCRKSKLVAQMTAVDHLSRDKIRVPQQLVHLLNAAFQKFLPDIAAGNFPAPVHLLFKNIHLKAQRFSHIF